MMYPNADAGSLSNYFLASQQLLKDLQPISVTDQLPECVYGTQHTHGGEQSETILVFANGWVAGVFIRPNEGDPYWEYTTEGISGYEWEVERIENVTHWMELPPAPEE